MGDTTLHGLAEARSLAYHTAIAARIRREPALIEPVAARLRTQLASDDPHRSYWAEAWLRVLEQPLEECLAFLTDPGERATEMRQSTPFAGLLPAKERWTLHKQVREQWRREGRLP